MQIVALVVSLLMDLSSDSGKLSAHKAGPLPHICQLLKLEDGMHLSDPAHSSVHMVIDALTVVRNIAMLEKHCLIKGLIHHAAAAGMSALDALMPSSPAGRQVYPSGSLRVWLQRRAGVLWLRFETHHSESAAATGRISFGPVSNGHHSESAPATRRRSFGPGFAHYAGSLCQDGRECRLHRVIMQRTLTPSRLPLAALRSLQRIRLGISVSYVMQRVHDSPVEIMGPAAEAAAWNGHQRILGSR